MLTIHILGIIFSVITIILTERKAYQWFRGYIPTINEEFVRRGHKMVWTFLIITWISGLMLFVPEYKYYIQNTIFLVKIVFVILLSINGFVIGKFMKVAWQKSFMELSSKEKKSLYISGVVSVVSWIGAIICGFIM